MRLFLETKAHLMVCTGPSCGRRGSAVLLRNTAPAPGVQLVASSCQGACSYGPNATAYFGQGGRLVEARYRGLDRERLATLVTALAEDRAPPGD